MRCFFLFAVLLTLALPVHAQDLEVNAPPVVLQGTSFEVAVRGAADTTAALAVRLGGETYPLAYDASAGAFATGDVRAASGGAVALDVVQGGEVIAQAETRAIPGWLSILPPLLAIGMALLVRRVVPSLFLGVWAGAWIAAGLSLGGAFEGLLDAFQVYVLAALADPSRAAIILFSLMIGGMVGIISKNGGTLGVVERIIGLASTPRRGQAATGLLGVAIFFDDYANTLIVGNTMRPITDRLRISREKLAYIVDSTAAPVACIALVTTWVGYEVGLIDDAVSRIAGLDLSGYTIFLQSIPYSFYPLLAIFFVFAVALTDREFGPMLEAERRARTTGKVLADDAKVDEAAVDGKELAAKEGIPRRALNAVVPVLVLVGGVMAGLYVTGAQVAGEGASLQEIIGEADSYAALLWGSLLSVLVAAALSIGQRLLTLEETVEAWYAGLKAMLFAMIVLVLAWALSDITGVLHTADYLAQVLGEALAPGLLPAIIFVLAAATAFATGSSWGTMAILYPLVIPLVWQVLQLNGMADPAHYHILFSATSCVLAGAVWGDHCSPISDTTILSSMASGCDHIDHVRTQLPYALTVGVVAVLLGTVPTGFGFPWWLSLLAGMAVLAAVLRFYGKPLDVNPPAEVPERRPAPVAEVGRS